MNIESERAAFEAWYETTYGISLEPEFRANHFIGYVNDKANHRWTAWQARAALSAPSHGEQVRNMVPDGWNVERGCSPSGYVLHSPGGSMIRVCDSGMGGIETAFAMFLKAMLAAAPSAGSQGGDV